MQTTPRKFIALLCLLAAVLAGNTAFAQSGAVFNATTALNPVGYWPLNDAVTPAVTPPTAVNSGTLGAAANGAYAGGFFPGFVPSALASDADTAAFHDGNQNSVISVPFNAAFANTAFSVESWTKPATNIATGTIVANALIPGNRVGWLMLANATNYEIRMYKNSSTASAVDLRGNIPGGRVPTAWYHVVVTYDGTANIGSVNMYINGQLVTNNTAGVVGYQANGSGTNTPSPMTLGNRTDGGFTYSGAMDEVAVYSTALSAADVLAHYQAGTNPTPATPYNTLVLNDSPFVYYRLDDANNAPIAINYSTAGASLNGYYESSGNGVGGGILTGQAGPPGTGFGPNNTSVNFSGSQAATIGAGVTTPGTAGLPVGINSANPVTLTAWVQVPGTVGWFQCVAGKGDQAYRFAADNPNGLPHFASAGNGDVVGSKALDDGLWHFWAAEWDGAHQTIYIDGAVASQNTATNGNNNARSFIIGCAPDDTGRNFIGNVAQVAVFSNALTAAQVQSIYFAAGGIPPVITLQPHATEASQGSNVSLTVSAVGSGTITYQWFTGSTGFGSPVANGGGVSGAQSPTLTFTGAQPASDGNYYVVVTDGNSLTTTSVGAELNVLTTSLPGNVFQSVIAQGPVAYWPLTETTQPNTLAPNLGTAGATDNGAYGGKVLTGQAGAIVGDPNTAVAFDGISANVSVPFNPTVALAPPFTIETWVNSAAVSGGTLAAASAMTAASPRSGWLLYQTAASWELRLYNQNAATPSLILDSVTAPTVGSYQHVVATFDGTNGQIFINGVLESNAPVTGINNGFVANVSGPLTLGYRSDGGFQWAGTEDEVAIYPTVLSAADIMAHYNNGIDSPPRAQSYSSLVLADNPLVYFRLGESITFPVAVNYGSFGSSANAAYQPGTLPGAAGPPSTQFGPASLSCGFVPANGAVVDAGVAAGTGLDILGPVSVSAWFKAGPSTAFESFLGIGDDSYRADISGNGAGSVVGAAHWNDAGNGEPVSPVSDQDNLWHFFTGVYDGGNNLLYIDGALVGTATAATIPSQDLTHDFVIGGVGDNLPGRNFAGNLAQVAVYSYALNAGQIQSMFTSGQLAPQITSQPTNQTIAQGNSATFKVGTLPSSGVTFQWFSGTPGSGTALSNGTDGFGATISGVTTATLTFANAQVGDGNTYFVVVSNSFGSITSSVATLLVSVAPTIVSQPGPATNTMYVGNQITFTVSALGTPPPAYQWFNGANPINGATSSNLVVKALLGTNIYDVKVTNINGSITSSNVTVIGQKFVVPTSGVFTVNFSVGPGSANPYAGVGAYLGDSSTNVWNEVPGASGATSGFATDSGLDPTLITINVTYGGNNAGAGAVNGTPSYLTEASDLVNGGAPGIGTSTNPTGLFVVSGLPQGAYTLYLYGANFDGDRGSIFAINGAQNDGVHTAIPDNGISSTTNSAVNPTGSDAAGTEVLAEGDNYVFFHTVVPDASGTISGTYVPDPNPLTGQNGEAPFNGLQLALHLISIQKTGANVTLNWSGGSQLQSATSLAGPWTTLSTTTPVVVPITGTEQFFRVF